ncbi:MAG: type III pantothenate kinase [Rhodospirillaceae bacterium]|nr:type III pantothenate kinase [Rhodospirillaceae bacterium]MCA8932538.1 type III pantothenate kinase [Rhodospirillaceae bacterium]
MLLAIDAGNTNVVFAVADGGRIAGTWRISTDTRRTADEYAVWLHQVLTLSGLTPRDITDVILGSVVPAVSFNLTWLCRKHLGREPKVVTKDLDLGIEIRLDNPAEAGIDRIVNAIAAGSSYPTPLIVVDIGTGTTFDVIDAEGHYIGGAIAPGPHPSLEALHSIAAQLPKVQIERPRQVIGRGTVAAMQSGIFWGYVSLIEGLLKRIQEEFGAEMTVIATGGLGITFAEATPMIHHYDRDLTIRGLIAIYDRMTAQ